MTGIFKRFTAPAFSGALLAIVGCTAGVHVAMSPAKAQQAVAVNLPAPRLVTPNEMETGALLFKAIDEGRYIQAPNLATDVEITVTGAIARAKVTQRFQNPTNGWVEGKYVFPLPDNSAVDTLKMMIGNRLIEGDIKEKAEARRVYEEAKRDGKKASLVEQTRPNVFTNSVANIGPGETIIIQIEYQEALKPDNNQFSLRFPLVVAPRYNPAPVVQVAAFGENGWAVSDPVPDRADLTAPVVNTKVEPAINPVVLRVNLEAGFNLGTIESQHHEVKIERSGNGKASITIDGAVPADRDFELTWAPAQGAIPGAALFREQIEGQDYAMVMLTAPAPDTLSGNSLPRDVTFVLDVSGSMAGQSIRQAKASLARALGQLTPHDRFNVIWFNNIHGAFRPAPIDATVPQIKLAQAFVNQLEATGGTEMLAALRASLATKHRQGFLKQIIFLTDGAIGNEAQLFAEIKANLGKSRLFTVGIGSAPNSFFMSRAAELGRGTFTHIGNLEQVADRMDTLFGKLQRPVLTDIRIIWPGSAKAEGWPNPVPDLYAGEPVVVSARGSALTGDVRIEGLLDGKPWSAIASLNGGADRPGIAKLWARAKIRSLEQARFGLGHETADGETWKRAENGINQQILQTALQHHLVSRLTSLVAVDKTPSRPQGEQLSSAKVPVNLPAGWDFAKVFGNDFAPLDQTAPDAGSDLPRQKDAATGDTDNVQLASLDSSFAAKLVLSPAPPAAMPASAPLVIPSTATDAQTQMLIGLVSLLFAMSLLLTMVFWQRLFGIGTGQLR